MNLQLLDQLRNRTERIKNEIIGNRSKPLFSYRLSMKSQREWAEYERQESIRRAVVAKARELIEWSHVEYEAAKEKHKGNIKVLTELMLNWNPERVLSKHREFANLCRALSDDVTWRMLTVKERRFIADSVLLKG